MKPKCEYCRTTLNPKRITYHQLHRHFCSAKCREDWLEMMNRILEGKKPSQPQETCNA